MATTPDVPKFDSEGYELVSVTLESEEFVDAVYKHDKAWTIIYSLILTSKKQIPDATLEKTLRLLQRKIPSLQLCLRNVEGVLWFCKMKGEMIDFEVQSGASSSSDLLDDPIKNLSPTSNGPLWKVVCTRVENKTHQSSEENYVIQVRFAFHHGFTDAHSNLLICQNFLSILDNIMQGNQVSSSEVGKFARLSHNDDELDQAQIQARQEMLAKMQTLCKKSDDWCNKKHANLGKSRPTCRIPKDLDATSTMRLHEKFKKAGITFNSGICAIIESAIASMLNEHTNKVEQRNITSLHAVNMRRYYENSHDYFGCNYAGIQIPSQIESLDREEDFWNHARSLNSKIKSCLANKSFANSDIQELFDLDMSGDMKDLSQLLKIDMTNIGNTSSVVECDWNNFQVDRLERAESLSYTVNTSPVHHLHTFRGMLFYDLSYVPAFLEHEIATKYIKKIFEKINEIIA